MIKISNLKLTLPTIKIWLRILLTTISSDSRICFKDHVTFVYLFSDSREKCNVRFKNATGAHSIEYRLNPSMILSSLHRGLALETSHSWNLSKCGYSTRWQPLLHTLSKVYASPLPSLSVREGRVVRGVVAWKVERESPHLMAPSEPPLFPLATMPRYERGGSITVLCRVVLPPVQQLSSTLPVTGRRPLLDRRSCAGKVSF